MKLRGLVPKFYIQESGIDLYVPTIILFGISFTLKVKIEFDYKDYLFPALLSIPASTSFSLLLLSTKGPPFCPEFNRLPVPSAHLAG